MWGLDDYDSAIDQLEAGYGITGDERLKTRRDELGPKGSTEVVWTDPVLEQMVRTALGIPEGTTVYVRDLDEVEWMCIYGNQYILSMKIQICHSDMHLVLMKAQIY